MTPDRGLALFCAGAWCWVAVGAAHLAVVLLKHTRAPRPAEAAVLAAMRGHPVRLLGLTRDLFTLTLGYSVTMGCLAVCGGAVSLLVARAFPDVVARAPELAGFDLAASLLALALSVKFFPPPPIVAFAIASVCFALALAG